MRRRILVAILSVAVLAIGLFAVPLAIVVERLVDQDAMLRVERQAILAARVVPESFATTTDPVELPTNQAGIRLGLYDVHGNLISGTGPRTPDTATHGALVGHVTDAENDVVRVVAVPVTVDEQVIGVIRAEQSTAGSDARTQRILLLLGSLAIGVIAIGAAAGYVIAGRIARPVGDLADAAVRLGDGDFTVTVRRSKLAEIDQAGVAMTATAARLDDLVARERAFSADASHQLRTPLAGLRAAIETELEFPRADPSEVLRESLDDIERLERTINELLTIARTRDANGLQPLALDHTLRALQLAWHGRFANVGRPLTVADAASTPEVVGNATILRHALEVLLDNALVHGRGRVTVEVHPSPDAVIVTVSDEGPGFHTPPDQTTEDHSRPSGHGLPLAQRLAAGLPGRLVLRRTTHHPAIDIVLQRSSSAEADD